ncbi:MAG: hypothetical protein ACODAQ_06475 [Phycisphaeraceae bacterium]
MSVSLPDARELAAAEAAQINANPEQALQTPLKRALMDAPWLDREAVIAGTVAFHRERMQRVPAPAKYPEAGPWVQLAIDVDRELQALTGISDEQLALRRSLREYMTFRCHEAVAARPSGEEKCRALYVPESEHGEIHVKNLDDPSWHWKPRPPIEAMPSVNELRMDGVGSGLHIDDEPDEIFPLQPRQMVTHYCNDVPGAVQFMQRYSPFWGRANLLLFDAQRRSVAIEKCSFNHCEVFEPDAHGRSFISGMTCRDADSPQGRHQQRMRERAVGMSGRADDDSPDRAFWAACRRFHEKLRDAVVGWGERVSLDEVIRLFTTPAPEGLNKENARFHPDQPIDAWTLATTVWLRDQRRVLRWQRAEGTMAWPTEPEVYQF